MSIIKDAVLNSSGSSFKKLILVLWLLAMMLISGIYVIMKFRKKESVRNEQVIEVRLPDGTITEINKIN